VLGVHSVRPRPVTVHPVTRTFSQLSSANRDVVMGVIRTYKRIKCKMLGRWLTLEIACLDHRQPPSRFGGWRSRGSPSFSHPLASPAP
jgi:hypothetical protein